MSCAARFSTMAVIGNKENSMDVDELYRICISFLVLDKLTLSLIGYRDIISIDCLNSFLSSPHLAFTIAVSARWHGPLHHSSRRIFQKWSVLLSMRTFRYFWLIIHQVHIQTDLLAI